MSLDKNKKLGSILFQQHHLPIESVVVSDDLLADVGRFIHKEKAKCVVIIVSPSLAEKSDLISRFIKNINDHFDDKSQVIEYSFFETLSSRERILKLASQLKGSKVDLVIAIGGGSIIDLAKMVCFCLNKQAFSKEEMQRYAKFSNGDVGDRYGKGNSIKKEAPLKASLHKPVVIISIPTTLSGASYSESASVLDESTKTKEGYRDNVLCPRAIFYHPELTHDTPEWLWFSSAIRSMDHAIESLCSSSATAFYNEQFLQALCLFRDSLPMLKANYSNDSARVMSQQAESFACSGLGRIAHGASHGIGYILTEMFDVPQGYASCVLLPAVLQWNQPVCHEQQLLISEALGCRETPAATMVKDLILQLELPTSLKSVINLPIDDSLLLEIAKRAFNHPVTRRNPRQIDDLGDILTILKLAM